MCTCLMEPTNCSDTFSPYPLRQTRTARKLAQFVVSSHLLCPCLSAAQLTSELQPIMSWNHFATICILDTKPAKVFLPSYCRSSPFLRKRCKQWESSYGQWS